MYVVDNEFKVKMAKNNMVAHFSINKFIVT